jgi:hypothetical protein
MNLADVLFYKWHSACALAIAAAIRLIRESGSQVSENQDSTLIKGVIRLKYASQKQLNTLE